MSLSHRHLINEMKALHITAREIDGGICFGLVGTDIHCFLDREVCDFDELVQVVHTFANGEGLPKEIELAQKDYIQSLKYAKKTILKHWGKTENELSEEQRKILNEFARSNANAMVKSCFEPNLKLLQVLPFYNEIQLFLHACYLKHLFPKGEEASFQNLQTVFDFLYPEAKEDKAKPGITRIKQFSGCYSVKELTSYFKALVEAINMHQIDNQDLRISLLLTSRNHAIHVGFNSKSGLWRMMNANQLPAKKEQTTQFETMSKHVLAAFFDIEPDQITNDIQDYRFQNIESMNAIFSTEVFVHNQCTKEAQLIIDSWMHHMADLHHVDHDKAGRFDSYNTNWLNIAIISGDVEKAKQLVQTGVNIDAPDCFGCTPLINAASIGSLEIVEALLAQHVSIDAQNKEGYTPLHMAICNGNHEVIFTLMSKSASFKSDNTDFPVSLLAIERGDLVTANKCFDQGIDVNWTNSNGDSLLLIAAQHGHKDIVTLLLNRGANVAYQNPYGENVLFVAAKFGHTDIVKLLLDHGMLVDESNLYKESPLFIAAENGHLSVVNVLLSHKANVDQPDDRDMSPLFMAAANGHLEVAASLLAYGADPDYFANNASTPLCFAAQNGHLPIMNLLINSRASFKVIFTCDTQFLMKSALKAGDAQAKALTALLEKQFGPLDLNALPKIPFFSVFLTGAFFGRTDVITLLFFKGTDLKNTALKMTAIDLAQAMGHEETVNRLKLFLAYQSCFDDSSMQHQFMKHIFGLHKTKQLQLFSQAVDFFNQIEKLRNEPEIDAATCTAWCEKAYQDHMNGVPAQDILSALRASIHDAIDDALKSKEQSVLNFTMFNLPTCPEVKKDEQLTTEQTQLPGPLKKTAC